AEARGFGAATVDPGLALCDARCRPQKRHDPVGQLAGELDGPRRDGSDVNRDRLRRRALREMGWWALAPEPASYRRDVAPQRRRRILHVDPERLVDRRMTDAEPQNEASARGVGDEGRDLPALG